MVKLETVQVYTYLGLTELIQLSFHGAFIFSLLINFVESDSRNVWQGYLLAVLMFSLSVLGCLFMNQSFYITMQTGQHLRSAIITAIYRKVHIVVNPLRAAYYCNVVCLLSP